MNHTYPAAAPVMNTVLLFPIRHDLPEPLIANLFVAGVAASVF
jgi:hypothetical protein